MLKISYKGFFRKIGTEYGLQPELLKREMNHSEITKYNYKKLRYFGETNLKLDVLCLPFIYAKHSMEMQIMSCFGMRCCLTEDSLGWKCFGTFNKDREFYTLNDTYVRDFISQKHKGWEMWSF